jgi:hypothetical protein
MASIPAFRKTGFKRIVINKKAINPPIKNLYSCFETENLFLIRKMVINTNTSRIPFSFVKKAREDMMKAKTM